MIFAYSKNLPYRGIDGRTLPLCTYYKLVFRLVFLGKPLTASVAWALVAPIDAFTMAVDVCPPVRTEIGPRVGVGDLLVELPQSTIWVQVRPGLDSVQGIIKRIQRVHLSILSFSCLLSGEPSVRPCRMKTMVKRIWSAPSFLAIRFALPFVLLLLSLFRCTT